MPLVGLTSWCFSFLWDFASVVILRRLPIVP